MLARSVPCADNDDLARGVRSQSRMGLQWYRGLRQQAQDEKPMKTVPAWSIWPWPVFHARIIAGSRAPAASCRCHRQQSSSRFLSRREIGSRTTPDNRPGRTFAFRGQALEDPRLLLGIRVSVHLVRLAFWIGALGPSYGLSGRTAQVALVAREFGEKAVWIVGLLIAAVLFLAAALTTTSSPA